MEGSVLKAITKYFNTEFQLTQEQREQLAEIESETAMKIKEETKKFKEALKKIESDRNAAVGRRFRQKINSQAGGRP